MESTRRRECSSASDIDFVFKYPEKRSEYDNLVKDSEEPRLDEDAENAAEDASDEVVLEELYDVPKTNTINIARRHAFKKKLTLDALMITPPKIETPKSPLESNTEDAENSIVVNTKALPKDARTYELEKFQKNCLIIFNQESIDGFEPRLGTKQDVEVLTETFEAYGFDVVEHKDFTKEKIMEVLETFKTTNFSEYGCVGVVVLTHGSFNGLLRAKDQVYSETEIINYFRVYDKPTLITKPKLLIIQACRGTRCLPGVMVLQHPMGSLRKDLDAEVEPYSLPVMSDMLIVHSSYIGEASTRDELHGSWFIQTLCSKIKEMSPTHDLESILTEVKREVAADRHWEDYNRATREMDIYKQMPTVTSTLIRKLYLRRFGEESPSATFLDAPVRAYRNQVLDVATPLLVQFGPCSCFLEHFDYIKKCLMFYLEENPCDATARTFLDISNTFESEDKFNAAKERMAKAICEHLNQNARHCEFFKFLYFYKHS